MDIKLYTDGACSPNPGKGGYGIVLTCGEHRKELSAGYRLTTNNRMELLAVIIGLESITSKEKRVLVYSDSRYVIDSINKCWVYKWKRSGFLKAKNVDLWKRFLEVHNPNLHEFYWVKGHNGHVENERCDTLAVAASKGGNLLDDLDSVNTPAKTNVSKKGSSVLSRYKMSLEDLDKIVSNHNHQKFSYKPEHGGVSYRNNKTKTAVTVFLTTLTVCVSPKGKQSFYIRNLTPGMIPSIFDKY